MKTFVLALLATVNCASVDAASSTANMPCKSSVKVRPENQVLVPRSSFAVVAASYVPAASRKLLRKSIVAIDAKEARLFSGRDFGGHRLYLVRGAVASIPGLSKSQVHRTAMYSEFLGLYDRKSAHILVGSHTLASLDTAQYTIPLVLATDLVIKSSSSSCQVTS